jgi:nucleotide-binding universal stress UspA family protein
VTEEKNERQQILVALDGSRESLAALDAAVSLAKELDADLIGLFVEDINLVRLAQMPFAREVHLTTARFRTLTSTEMSAAMRVQAARIRRALRNATQQAGVRSEFRIVRGLVPTAVTAAAVNADLLILGRISRPLNRRIRLGSTARAALAQVSRSILLMRQHQATERSVLVTFDNTDLSWRALRKAVALSDPDYPLTLLLLTPSLAEAKVWQAQIEVWLEERSWPANFRHLPQATMPRLLQVVQEEHCDLLIIGGERLPVSPDTAVSLLNQLDCSLMLVR